MLMRCALPLCGCARPLCNPWGIPGFTLFACGLGAFFDSGGMPSCPALTLIDSFAAVVHVAQVWDLGAFFDSGGMPSSHSSLCSSVTTAIAMQQGLGSPLFSVAVCFRCGYGGAAACTAGSAALLRWRRRQAQPRRSPGLPGSALSVDRLSAPAASWFLLQRDRDV